jgi:hypothetical protein
MAYDDLLGLIPEFGENFALLLALALLYSLIGLPLLRRAGHFGAVAAGLLFGNMAILGMRWPIAIAAGEHRQPQPDRPGRRRLRRPVDRGGLRARGHRLPDPDGRA